MSTTTVLIVYDDEDLLSRWPDTLRREGYEVHCAASCREATLLMRTIPGIDIAYVDMALPDGSGCVLLKQIERRHEQVRAILVSAFFDSDTEGILARMDIRGISKPLVDERLVELTEELSRPPDLLRDAVERLASRHRLSCREVEVVECLARGVDDIQRRLCIRSRTLDTHWKKILGKTGLGSRVMIVVAVLADLCFDPDVARALVGRFAVRHGLSPTETQVLQCVVEGAGAGVLPARLNICASTLKSHWTQIRTKTGLHSKLEVVVELVHLRLEDMSRS